MFCQLDRFGARLSWRDLTPRRAVRRIAARLGPIGQVALFFAMLVVVPAARAETASEAQLRAAYLVNFLKYVEWPGGASRATICLFGQDGLAASLAAYEGRTVQGREIHIRRVNQPEQLSDCQEVFVSAADEDRYPALLREAGRSPMLTVGEHVRFIERGGGVALVRVDNRLVFDLNLTVINRAGLKVSPQMLRLARDVQGGAR